MDSPMPSNEGPHCEEQINRSRLCYEHFNCSGVYLFDFDCSPESVPVLVCAIPRERGGLCRSLVQNFLYYFASPLLTLWLLHRHAIHTQQRRQETGPSPKQSNSRTINICQPKPPRSPWPPRHNKKETTPYCSGAKRNKRHHGCKRDFFDIVAFRRSNDNQSWGYWGEYRYTEHAGWIRSE